jgi:hypothetical protein
MAHVRTQLRAALVTHLTGLPLTGANVFGGRRRRLDETQLPALVVEIGEETLDYTVHPVQKRRAEVVVHIHAFGPDETIDALLEDIADNVEGAMTVAITGFPSQQVLLAALAPTYDPQGEQLAGELALTYVVEYFTQTGAPDAAL